MLLDILYFAYFHLMEEELIFFWSVNQKSDRKKKKETDSRSSFSSFSLFIFFSQQKMCRYTKNSSWNMSFLFGGDRFKGEMYNSSHHLHDQQHQSSHENLFLLPSPFSFPFFYNLQVETLWWWCDDVMMWIGERRSRVRGCKSYCQKSISGSIQ